MKIAERELREMLADVVESSAMSLLDPDRLQAIAEDLRVVERRRDYDAGLVAVSIVLSALQRSTDTQGRLADARRVYEMLGGGATKESGFRKAARKVAPVLREVLNRRLGTVTAGVADSELRGRLSALGDVLIPDGCAFKLANTLAATYAGTGQPSEMKFHAVYSVRAGGIVSLHATAGAVHDNDGFAPQVWVPGSLYIWDLGYNDYGRVVAATKAGALVLQRLKSGANPKVLASFGPGGHRRELHSDDGGEVRLDEACAMGLVHRQRVLDLDAELREDGEVAIVRIVCVPFGGEDRYYLTTLARDVFSPHDVAELYRLRWEIELFFRGLKGATRLDEVRRLENEESLHAIVYGSLLAALLARDITAKLNELETSRQAEQAPAEPAEAFPPGALRTRGASTRGGPRRSPAFRATPEAQAPADLLRSRLAARSSLPSNHRTHERLLES
jgi:putative transposase